jgi:hypothetical protein
MADMTLSPWVDFFGFAAALTCLEAAITGTGRTTHKGHVNLWSVSPRLRPILGVAGIGLLIFVAVDLLKRFG